MCRIGRTEDKETPQVERRPVKVLRNFQEALEKGYPGLYGTLSLEFFEAVGKAVAQMWVIDGRLSFDILEMWRALIQSQDILIVRFLIAHPIEGSEGLYVYKPEGEHFPTGRRLGAHIRLEVASHFPSRYRLVRPSRLG